LLYRTGRHITKFETSIINTNFKKGHHRRLLQRHILLHRSFTSRVLETGSTLFSIIFFVRISNGSFSLFFEPKEVAVYYRIKTQTFRLRGRIGWLPKLFLPWPKNLTDISDSIHGCRHLLFTLRRLHALPVAIVTKDSSLWDSPLGASTHKTYTQNVRLTLPASETAG